ncbi:MAG: transcription termination factor Rho [Opitutales bacterium]|nr:transcription termination factor Rho [Opitutales bacterium]
MQDNQGNTPEGANFVPETSDSENGASSNSENRGGFKRGNFRNPRAQNRNFKNQRGNFRNKFNQNRRREAQPESQETQEPLEIIQVEGIFDLGQNNNGVLLDPKRGGKTRPTDTYIPRELVKRFNLKRGQYLVGKAHKASNHQNPKLRFIETIDGVPCMERKKVMAFKNLTTIAPDEKLKLETSDERMTNRVIDIFCPIGKGTRGLIVAPPRTGKTTLLKDIAFGVLENHPECHLIILLVDERPEEVTDFRIDLPKAEIFASSNDENIETHVKVADLAIERAKHLVEVGRDVVLLMDSLTRLSRAHNALKGGGGRTMSGGLDIRALERPRQIFSAARNTEEAGSLTIVASALIETGSKMDELIFQEFKGTGNIEMVLDRKVAELRIWPAINLASSGTRREELLLSAKELEAAAFLRRAMAGSKTEDATETLISRMSQTKSNAEFLNIIL